MVSLELRETDVTRAADVVFPVAPVSDKAGTFVNWEGRPRPFDAVLTSPASLPDLRVLAGIAEEAGVPRWASGPSPRSAAQMEELGPWDGERATAPAAPTVKERKLAKSKLWLASWKQMIDDGRCRTATSRCARPPARAVARVSEPT